MPEDSPNPQINVSKIPGGGGLAGALFAIISMLIFLIGIPLLRYFLVGAVVLGGAVALVVRFMRHQTPGTPWIRAATETAPEPQSQANRDERGDVKDFRGAVPPIQMGPL